MSPPSEDERFVVRLAELDEAISAGSRSIAPDSTFGPSQAELSADPSADTLAGRLSESEACLRILARLRVAHPDLLEDALPRDADRKTSELGAELPTRIGRFEVVRELGRGGYGVVWLAFDPSLDRHVALKVPRPEVLIDSDHRQRFLREGKAAALLSHPNLVPVYEAGNDGVLCYLTSEYCDGTSLSQWLAGQSAPADCNQAASWVADLAEAVQHAHSRGVLHRDIKPSNVLLDRSAVADSAHKDAALLPKLTDFGLARLADTSDLQTRSTAIVGTPAYMAPEQAAGGTRQVGPPADVYALGAMLFELLSRRPPFQGETYLDTLEQARSRQPPSLRSLRGDVPRDLAAICAKCLEKQPSARYGTAQSLADDLRRFLGGLPVQARLASPLERAARWCRRNPVVAALNAAVILLLASLAIYANLAAARLSEEVQRVTAARTEAEQQKREASEARDAALDSEYAMLERLFDSRMAEATATRLQVASGQRTTALAALDEAAQLVREIDVAPDQLELLRQEYAATLGELDLSVHRSIPLDFRGAQHLARSADGQYAAVYRIKTNQIDILELAGNQVVSTIAGENRYSLTCRFEFDPSSRRLAIHQSYRGAGDYVDLWDWPRAERLGRYEKATPTRGSSEIDFHPTKPLLVLPAPDNRIQLVDTVSGQRLREVQLDYPPLRCRFHPTQHTLAVVHEIGLDVVDLDSGESVLPGTESPPSLRGTPVDFRWSPNGALLAVVTDKVQLWDMQRREKHLEWSVTEGNPQCVFFSPHGDLLATSTFNGDAQVWSPGDGRLLWQGRGHLKGFTGDNESLMFCVPGQETGDWELTRSSTYQLLDPATASHRPPTILAGPTAAAADRPASSHLSLSLDQSRQPTLAVTVPLPRIGISRLITLFGDRILLCGRGNELVLWDLHTQALLGALRAKETSQSFIAADGEYLMLQVGAARWRWRIGATEHVDYWQLDLGEPTKLLPFEAEQTRDWRTVSLGSDSRIVLVGGSSENERLAWFDLLSSKQFMFSQDFERSSLTAAAISPRGRHLAAHDRGEKRVIAFDAHGAQVWESASEFATLQFTSGGNYLLIRDLKQMIWVDTSKWQVQHTEPLLAAGRRLPLLAVTDDGEWFATLDEKDTILLKSTRERSLLCSWKVSTRDRIMALQFSRNQRWLFAGTTRGTVHVIDLQATHSALAAAGIEANDTAGSPLPLDTKPVHLNIEWPASLPPALPTSPARARRTPELLPRSPGSIIRSRAKSR